MVEAKEGGKLGDDYDRSLRALHGRAGVVKTEPRTIRAFSPVLELASAFVIQTWRDEEGGEWVSVEHGSGAGFTRIMLPPSVTSTIARQAAALSAKVRREHGRRIARERKARGELPGFMKGKQGKR